MAASDLKEQVMKYVDMADDKLLMAIKVLVENYKTDTIEIYTVKGQALTNAQVKQVIEDAEAEYRKGNFTEHDDLKKEMKSWKK